MTRLLPLLAAAGLSLALGGCLGTRNRGLESVHQPVVDRNDYALDLRTSGGALAAGEQARLGDWFEALRLGYGDRVAVDDPAGVAPRAAAEVRGAVAGYGLMLAPDAPMTAAAVAPGTVRVVVSRSRASVPGCPDWSRPASPNFDQHTSSNHGCAVNGMLAIMVADPADLVRGRPGATVNDPAASTKAIVDYRTRPQSGAGGAMKTESAGGN